MRTITLEEHYAPPRVHGRSGADELRRTVAMHGFKGALINGHSRGR